MLQILYMFQSYCLHSCYYCMGLLKTTPLLKFRRTNKDMWGKNTACLTCVASVVIVGHRDVFAAVAAVAAEGEGTCHNTDLTNNYRKALISLSFPGFRSYKC